VCTKDQTDALAVVPKDLRGGEPGRCAALDLGIVGRRFPGIRTLPVVRQVADQLATPGRWHRLSAGA
jgi:hypothetical protein